MLVSLLLTSALSKQLSDTAMPAEGHEMPHAIPGSLQPHDEPGQAAGAAASGGGGAERREQEHTGLKSMTPAYMENVKSKATCPSHMHGVLFNHIPKTGGTAFFDLVKATFLPNGKVLDGHDGGHDLGHDYEKLKKTYHKRHERPLVIYQAGEAGKSKADVHHQSAGSWNKMRYDGTGVVSEKDANMFFTMGLLRKPCDFMLSVYGLHNGYKETTHADKPALTAWVLKALNASDDLRKKDHNMMDVFDTGVLSDRVRVRYGSGNIHCMSTMDTMKDDFTACRHRYRLCGGQVSGNNTDDDYLFATLKETGSKVSEHGRSVGDHASCSNMFDADLQAAVMDHERHLVREFNLGSCCPQVEQEGSSSARAPRPSPSA